MVGPKIRVLFIGANPTDTQRLALTHEAEAIQAALAGSTYGERFDLRQRWRTSLGRLSRLLLRHDPHILHFSGHGSCDGQLYFVDRHGRAVAADEHSIASLFRSFVGVQCVVLNACHSARQAELIAEHVDVVIGIDAEVCEVSARAFAVGFYEALGFGRALGCAFELACSQAVLTSGVATPFRVYTRDQGLLDHALPEPPKGAPDTQPGAAEAGPDRRPGLYAGAVLGCLGVAAIAGGIGARVLAADAEPTVTEVHACEIWCESCPTLRRGWIVPESGETFIVVIDEGNAIEFYCPEQGTSASIVVEVTGSSVRFMYAEVPSTSVGQLPDVSALTFKPGAPPEFDPDSAVAQPPLGSQGGEPARPLTVSAQLGPMLSQLADDPAPDARDGRRRRSGSLDADIVWGGSGAAHAAEDRPALRPLSEVEVDAGLLDAREALRACPGHARAQVELTVDGSIGRVMRVELGDALDESLERCIARGILEHAAFRRSEGIEVHARTLEVGQP